MKSTAVARDTMATALSREFFTEAGLSKHLAGEKEDWAEAVLKELIDNALDACENSNPAIAPEIKVVLQQDTLTLADNGPGFPAEDVERSAAYEHRVSDKAGYKSPTRGQQGNALKCIYTVAAVYTGKPSRTVITAKGVKHTIAVVGDPLVDAPIKYSHKDAKTNTGTIITLEWPGIGESNLGHRAFFLLQRYAAFNPHATFVLSELDGKTHEWRATNPGWKKWRTVDPTSAHWYLPKDMKELIDTYNRNAKAGRKKDLFVSEFLARFDGLSSTGKQAQILQDTGLKGKTLLDLNGKDDKIAKLLSLMQENTRPVEPTRLGLIGEDHIKACFELFNPGSSFEYKKYPGTFYEDNGLEIPAVLEVAFCMVPAPLTLKHNLFLGLNNSPTLKMWNDDLTSLLTYGLKLGEDKPVAVFIHLTHPRLIYTSSDKNSIALPLNIQAELRTLLEKATKEYRRADKKYHGDPEKVRAALAPAVIKAKSIKASTFDVLPDAYAKASGNGEYPASIRQIYYAARPDILDASRKPDLAYGTFTKYFEEFMNKYPQYRDWDVVYDARGHFHEPHTELQVDLGTIAVREYIEQWGLSESGLMAPSLDSAFRTYGPRNRFKYALFIEKEGFEPLLRRARIAEEFDIAIFSTKGNTTRAARKMADKLSQDGVTILLAHDYDTNGLVIARDLKQDSDLYTYEAQPEVIDFGLTLADVQEMRLETEGRNYDQETDPKINLRTIEGVTEDDLKFLVGELVHDEKPYWTGKRVELNAMTSVEFIAWLRRKFRQYKIEKFMPDSATLQLGWQKAKLYEQVNAEAQRLTEEMKKSPVAGENLEERIRQLWEEHPEWTWDKALYEITKGEI
jgi:DNA topoisomerase VI subunit B